MSTIKIARAKALAAHTPVVEVVIWASIPETLRDRLTAAELAEIARALDSHWHKAVTATERAACADGIVWDARAGQMRELKPVAKTA